MPSPSPACDWRKQDTRSTPVLPQCVSEESAARRHATLEGKALRRCLQRATTHCLTPKAGVRCTTSTRLPPQARFETSCVRDPPVPLAPQALFEPHLTGVGRNVCNKDTSRVAVHTRDVLNQRWTNTPGALRLREPQKAVQRRGRIAQP